MIHYITNIVSQSEVISKREAIFFEAGYKRVMFICNAIDDDITIVSMGASEKKGFFKKVIENHSQKIKIVYLPQWHITLFKKKLRHVFYSFFLLSYLFKNVRGNDRLILYNTSKSFFMIIPVLVFKMFRNVKYLLEIEELYSYHKESVRLGFAERISIKKASACIIVNENIRKFMKPDKPFILNAGYYSKAIKATEVSQGKKTDEIQIIYSGRLDREGGILIFLDAIQFINFKCKVLITGKGEYEDVVKKHQCHNPKVEYKYLGVLREEEYAQLLIKSQVAINPILQTHDFGNVSFPSKVTQYLAYGLKVVSSNINSLSILEGLNAYIYTYDWDDSREIAGIINSLKIDDFNGKEIIIEKTKKYFENSKRELSEFIIKC